MVEALEFTKSSGPLEFTYCPGPLEFTKSSGPLEFTKSSGPLEFTNCPGPLGRIGCMNNGGLHTLCPRNGRGIGHWLADTFLQLWTVPHFIGEGH